VRRRATPVTRTATLTRREALVTAAAVVLFGAAHQGVAHADKRRVAYLSPSSVASGGGHLLAQFVLGLRELGWIEGTNLIVDARWGQNDAARYASLTSELLALQPDVFVGSTDFVLGPAVAATKTVPIVFIVSNDPVARGLVKSLSRPGANVTGLTTLDHELNPKRLALLKEAIPGLSKVGVFIGSLNVGPFSLDETEAAARTLGLVLVPAMIDRPEDLDAAFETFARAGVKGVVDTATGVVTFLARDRVAALAIKHGIAMFGIPPVADSGVLLSYGYNALALWKRAATLVDRILRGASAAEIPVEQVNVYELVVNLRTARLLGIDVPRSLIVQASRVIE
jgi:putative tryptophan/tyrosine transport system substrate-binding protein